MNLRLQKWDSEQALIRACQKGDAAAQREIYTRYARKMLGVCLRYVNRQMEAEDILITGFMKVFDHLDGFKMEGSFEGWIRKIMVNEALGYLRKHKNRYLEVDIEVVHSQPHVYHIDSDDLEAEDLLKMVQNLPPGYRTAFNLYAIEGYSHKEIAGMLGINENTSKSQLSRARALLQQYVQNTQKKTAVVEAAE